MTKAVNKVSNLTEELMELVMAKVDKDTLMRMDSDEFKLLQLTIKLVEASTELQVKSVETVEQINRKLDLLIEKLEERP